MSGRATAIGLLLAGAAGFAVSVYLTFSHYSGAPLVCAAAGPIDCGAVTTSRWSLVPGTMIPVAAAGVLWFVVSAGLAALALRRPNLGWLAPAQLAWCAAGVVAVLYLVYGELVVVHRICEWCTAVHALVLLSLLLVQLRLVGEG